MERQLIVDKLLANGFKAGGAYFMGTINDYPAKIIVPVQKNAKNATVCFYLDTKPLNVELKAVKLYAKPFVNNLRYDSNTRMITCVIKEDKAGDLLEKINKLGSLATEFYNNRIFAPTLCGICKGENTDAFMDYKLRFQPVHQKCVLEQEASIKEKAENNSGSYLLGILGALIGAVIGCVPSILSIWFIETIYSILYALIPLCSYYGYKLLRGKMNWFAVFSTCVFSIFAVYIIHLSLFNIYVMTEYGATLTESLSFSFSLLVEDPTFFQDLTLDALQSFLFLLLGFIVVWRIVTQTNKSESKQIANSLNTLILRPGAEPLIRQNDTWQPDMENPITTSNEGISFTKDNAADTQL